MLSLLASKLGGTYNMPSVLAFRLKRHSKYAVYTRFQTRRNPKYAVLTSFQWNGNRPPLPHPCNPPYTFLIGVSLVNDNIAKKKHQQITTIVLILHLIVNLNLLFLVGLAE